MATKDTTYSFLTESKNPDELGMLGPYRVIDELGRGGMGFVFRAEDTRLQRIVALKVMNEKIAATKNSRTRFISEARAMAAVDHDNVVKIYEVGEKNGTPFMAMEMLQGETLEAFKARNERPNFEEVIDIAVQIARGLAAAHDKGIVHRDIKPANIWIESGSGRVKILDFGLALAQTPVDQLAGRGSVIGTPGYLSPEQARSEPLDNRSDLYSLGVVLYELCTAKLPLQAKSVAGQLIAILAHDPKPLREYNRDIPAPLAAMIHRLLSREPKDRPDSARALEEELKVVSDECHAKSEVALALNKLQAGLNEVVSKSHDSSGLDVLSAGAPKSVSDPFASIPDVLVASGSSPSSGRIPAVSSFSNPYAKPATPKQAPKKSGFNWQTHWPIVAIVSAACVAIPIVVYAWLFIGTSDSPTVASGPKVSSENVIVAEPKVDKPPSAGNKPNGNTGRKTGGNKGVGSRGGGGKKQASGANAPQVVIRTSDGRGADTSVGATLKEPQGAMGTLTVRNNPQKPRDSRHAYVKFDLASLPFSRQEIDSVTLTLPLSGTERPEASLKIHDVTGQLPEDWSDSGPNSLMWSNSPSKKKFASLPVIAEAIVTGEPIATPGSRNSVTVDSPQLTKMVRESSSDVISFAISADTVDDQPIKLLARENREGVVTPNRGPSLSVKAKRRQP